MLGRTLQPVLLFWLALTACVPAAYGRDLQVLFLGDNGPHQPSKRFAVFQPALAERGIALTYTEDVSKLELENLKRFDALVLYANIDRIDPQHADALLRYVEEGGGFVPLHCATFCFRNSREMVALMGAQFQRHGTGVFRTQIAERDHPVMNGFNGFESWDETYVHHMHNEKDRTVLAYRVDSEGREPWTWVRTQGNGRVFYTAWGHDLRTWRNPGFHNLVERGIRWAAKDDPGQVPEFQGAGAARFPVPEMTPLPSDAKPLEYVDVGRQIPNYPQAERWGVQDEPLSQMQKPLSPEESMKHMVVPQGFHVELFAAEPDIGGKPICMAWDERGRLWVAESYDYPNELQPPGKGRDRIRILEDSDGDGRADKFTVFAEDLSIPTSMTFHRGGAIVQNGGQTLYLKDLDGDDQADQRDVLFTGWGIVDTHGGVSNFRYGLDNWIWAMQGYNESRPVVRGEPLEYSFRQGFFRFRPDGSEIEFLRSTNNNTWGLGLSEEGLVFGSTANRNPSVFMPIANRYYERVAGWTRSLTLGSIADTHLFRPITDRVRQVDQHGGYTAGAGHALYTARAYPQEYWNRTAFVNGPTGHLVGVFVLARDGAGYTSSNPFNLLASNDEWTAPIMAEVGPDGHVWVIDWYNFIVQHNPTPKGFTTGKGMAYETSLRDKKHGRIYRVVYGDEKPTPFSLADASPDELVDALSHPTMLWRSHAQRLLVERGKDDVVRRLVEVAGDDSVDEIGLNVGVIHALWTLHGLGHLDGRNDEATAAALAALQHKSPGVRRNAIQVMPASESSTRAILDAGLLRDPDRQVRLAALLALSDLPPLAEAGSELLSTLRAPAASDDPWIIDAVVSAAANHSGPFLRAAVESVDRQSDDLLDVVMTASRHAANRLSSADGLALVRALSAAANENLVSAVISGLAAGGDRNRQPIASEQLDQAMNELFARLAPAAQSKLVIVARRWGSVEFEARAAEIAAALLARLDNEQLDAAQRVAAAQELVAFADADDETAVQLLDRITPQLEPNLASGIVSALSASEAPELGAELISRLPGFTPAARTIALEVLLQRAASTRALLDALDDREVRLSELSLEQRQALSYHPESSIRRRARRLMQRSGSLPNPDRQKVLEELTAVVETAGDVDAGKQVFTKHCATCHRHSGEGKEIGPELTGMAVHPKLELLTHIIDPNRDIEGNYRVYVVRTMDGRAMSGLLASESNTAIELIDSKGVAHAILRDDVDEISARRVSLMPEGFEKEMSHDELINLLEFLTHRGAFQPLDLSKAAAVACVDGTVHDDSEKSEPIVFDESSPAHIAGVPFRLIDSKDGKVKNAIMLRGPSRRTGSLLPESAVIPCETSARAIHILAGVSRRRGPVGPSSQAPLVVRLRYDDGQTEEHWIENALLSAGSYARVVVRDAPQRIEIRNAPLRYVHVFPRRMSGISEIEVATGDSRAAPFVVAATLEVP